MFPVTESEFLLWMTSALLVFFRLGAMLMVAPMLGALYVPVRIRLIFALSLSAAIVPILGPFSMLIEPFSVPMIVVVAEQILIGLAIGFIFQLLFEAVVIGMQTVSMSMGLGFAIFVDNQSGVQVPTLGQFYTLIAMLIFLAMDGHLAMVQLVFESFEARPPGAGIVEPSEYIGIVNWGSEMFSGALRIALPAATALLIANISIGVVSRAAPQLNLFAVGLPFTMLVGFIVLMFSLTAMREAFVAVAKLAFEQAGLIAGLR